ncbi:Aminopeptidase 2 mitochondrial [Rhizoclosmatium hyalinum]|nr:Aminopeptidase 2 mitochondrial [Rhizoclosmatium hyalinum]
MCKCLLDESTPLGGAEAAASRDVLPTAFIPRHYNIWLAPDLESFKYDGAVTIDLDVTEDTDAITLNAKKLNVINGTITVDGETQTASKIWYDTEKEEVTYQFDDMIGAGSKAKFHTEFTGIHNDALAAAKPIQVRLFTVKGLISQGAFALDKAARTLEYFSEYFDAEYPLPKSDLLAVPDFDAGAMENWGLVTYRNTALLVDEEKSTIRSKKGVAYVVAHELAHQWFGNLVTMQWWNDLWLNEGFATFVGWLAVDHLFPEWDIWTGYITGTLSGALNLDALRSSHPIDVAVKSALEVGQIFDAISYMKGSSIIRMLNDFLGGQVFMDGVRTYLQEFKYKNTVTADLWKHLAQSSGLDIPTLMYAWTQETGYPLITVESEVYDDDAKTLTVTLSQSRFLSGGELKPEEDTVTWWVPLTVVSHLTAKTGATKHVLSEKKGTITFPYDASENAFWKLNDKASGVYRVKYTDAQITSIGHILQTTPSAFSVGDRVQFLSDSYSLASAGLGGLNTALNFIKFLESESDYNVLSQITGSLGTLRAATFNEPDSVKDGIKALGRRVFSKHVEALGYEFVDGEDYWNRLKRSLAIEAAVDSDDAEVIEALRTRFDLFVAGDAKALHPELRSITYRTVLSNATVETSRHYFDAVLEIYKNPTTVAAEKSGALVALGSVSNLEIVKEWLDTTVWDKDLVKTQDFDTAIAGVRSNPHSVVTKDLLWTWFQENWDRFDERFPQKASLGGVFSISTSGQIGEEFAVKVEKWAAGEGLDEEGVAKRKKDVVGFKRALDNVLESIRTRTRFLALHRESLDAWVKESL